MDDASESSVSEAGSVGNGRGTADNGRGPARQPTSEQARLDALRGYGILDSEPERRFDDLAKLAATALEMPIAMVSLVDDKRQWSMAAVGVARSEVPRAHSFCTHALTQDWTLVIDDASLDARVSALPMVSGPTQARFYAGAPLITPEGHRVGTVCVIDRVPRSLSRRELDMLASIARQTIELLEHRLTAARLGAAQARLQTMATLIPICSHCRKVRDEANQWLTLERLVQAKTGSRFTHGICPDCVREHYPAAADDLLRNS